jgi:hypothetical protein
MDDLEGIPVVLQISLPAVAEVTFEPDTDNYPIVGGTDPELADKTIKISEIVYYSGAAGLSVLEYVKIDDELVIVEPYAGAYDDTGATVISFKFNMKQIFGRDYLALRNKIAAKCSVNAGGDAFIYAKGIAVDRVE